MRREFEMSEEDLEKLLEASRPIPLIGINCGPISSTQERANAAWSLLGKKMGFVPMTARPIPGKSPRFFMAEPMQ